MELFICSNVKHLTAFVGSVSHRNGIRGCSLDRNRRVLRIWRSQITGLDKLAPTLHDADCWTLALAISFWELVINAADITVTH